MDSNILANCPDTPLISQFVIKRVSHHCEAVLGYSQWRIGVYAGSYEKPIVLGVGEKTVAPFAGILPFEGSTTVHLCHMVTNNHPQLVGKVDFIALPVHAIGPFSNAVAETSTQLIKTVGVAHNRQTEEIERIYRENGDKIPPSDAYIGIILAGDAPTPENKILLFTEENAREIAREVSLVLKNRHLLILNGPRTGKYNPENLEEIKGAHREGNKDFITLAFVDELKKSGTSPEQFTLLDFQFGPPTQDMNIALGAIRAKPLSIILVPGESTSSISESVDVLQNGVVFVYKNTAMNDVHKAHVRSELEAGRIQLWQRGSQEEADMKENVPDQDVTPKLSAAETIATALRQQ